MTKPGARRLELMPLEKIQRAKRNPKQHDEGAIGASFDRFGYVEPMVRDERTGRLVAGHGRLHLLASLFEKAPGRPPAGVEVTRKGAKITGWLVPVIRGWKSKNDAEAEAYLIASNRTVELGGWDDGELTKMLKSMGRDEMAATGFDVDDLNELMRGLGQTEEDGADEQPHVPRESWVKHGQLFALGEHRLMCGSSTEAADVARLMDGERAGLMNTDPPYGIAYDSDSVHVGGTARAAIANDELQDSELQAFLEKAFTAAKDCALVANAGWYLWHAHLTQGFFAAAAAAAANVVLHRQIIWVKPQLILGRGQYHWMHEPCFFGWVDGHQPPDYGRGDDERNQTTVWSVGGVSMHERGEFDHPTPKPVGLFETPIVKHLKVGEICYEPFAGSGPQFIAAEKLQRRCFGMELEPRYVQAIIERWEKFTNRKHEAVE